MRGKYLLEDHQNMIAYLLFMKRVLFGIHQCIFPNIYNMQRSSNRRQTNQPQCSVQSIIFQTKT